MPGPLEKIRDRVIRKAYPELMAEDIQIEHQKLKDALFSYGDLSPEDCYIEVDESLADAPEVVICGGLAHELAHIVRERSLGKVHSSRDWLAYRISKKYKTLDERNTDLEVILRGFGNELLQFLIYAEEKRFPHYREDGLSIREVKMLLGMEKQM